MYIKDVRSYTRAFVVGLKDRFAVEGCLLGKRIGFHLSDDCVLTIVIPTIIRKGDRIVLGVPNSLDKYGIDYDEWGGWNRYVSIDDVKSFDAWISSVIVECYGNKMDSVEIQSKGNNLIHALQIINPDAIRVFSDRQSTDLCDVLAEVFCGTEGRPQPAIHLPFSFDTRSGRVSFTDLKIAIQNSNKPITMPYEILDNARKNLSRKDTRSAVLHCATAIEFRLKTLLVSFLDANKTDNIIKEIVLKQADGYSRLMEMCKRCSVPLAGLPNMKETVVDIRNRVIHGGYVPTCQEADKAYENTRQALLVLNTPMFE